MAQHGEYVPYTITAATSLYNQAVGTGVLWKAMTLAGVPANNAQANGAIGVLTTFGWSGDNITVGVAGNMKYVAGATVNSGARLTVTTSGYMISAVSGSYVVGVNLRNGVASGMVGQGYFNGFANPVAFDSQSAHIHTYDFQSFTAQMDLSATLAGIGVNIASGALTTGAGEFFGGVLISGTVSGGTSWARTYGQAIALAAASIPATFPVVVASGGLFTVAVSGSPTIGRAITQGTSGSAFRLQITGARVLTTSYA